MITSGAAARTAWLVLAVVIATDLALLALGRTDAAEALRPLAALALLAAFVLTVRRRSRPLLLTAAALALSAIAIMPLDVAPAAPLLPGAPEPLAALAATAMLLVYIAVLVPLWRRRRDGLRVLLAVPYAGMVIAVVAACADGAGPLLPAIIVYAIALTVMAFLAAGINALTWAGGTLLLVGDALLATSWFLPGAWVPASGLAVGAAAFAAPVLLVLGIARADAEDPERAAPAPSTPAPTLSSP